MKIIKNDKRSRVFYNTKSKEYIKYFCPKFSKRLKYFLGFGKYPGHNFKYISEILNSIGIKTVEIISFDKYKVVTEELEGISLKEALEKSNKEKSKIYLEKYIGVINKLIKNEIYFADYNSDNFYIFEDEIYALDLEDYRKDCLFCFRKKNMLDKMEEKIKSIPKKCLKVLNIGYNEIYKKIRY
ncbi:hypothetical protein [Fusobacterium sp. MFO224]|uniref:hypothetical protein n=1 Tax=Fusobacterium sp. MFO224 TaxID=3378070 RepID=UPI0038522D09